MKKTVSTNGKPAIPPSTSFRCVMVHVSEYLSLPPSVALETLLGHTRHSGELRQASRPAATWAEGADRPRKAQDSEGDVKRSLREPQATKQPSRLNRVTIHAAADHLIVECHVVVQCQGAGRCHGWIAGSRPCPGAKRSSRIDLDRIDRVTAGLSATLLLAGAPTLARRAHGVTPHARAT